MAVFAPQFMPSDQIERLLSQKTIGDRLATYAGLRAQEVCNEARKLLRQDLPVLDYLQTIGNVLYLYPRYEGLHQQALEKQQELSERLNPLERSAYRVTIWVLTLFGRLPKFETALLPTPNISCMDVGSRLMRIDAYTIIMGHRIIQQLRLRLPNEHPDTRIVLEESQGNLHVSERRVTQAPSQMTPAHIVQALVEAFLLDTRFNGCLTVAPSACDGWPMDKLGFEVRDGVYSMTKDEARARWGLTIATTENQLIHDQLYGIRRAPIHKRLS